MKIRHLILILLLFANSLLAEEVKVKTSLQPGEFLIGDWINLELEIVHPLTVEVVLPKPGEKLGDFYFLDKELLSQAETDKSVVEKWKLTVAAYDTGEITLPPLPINYHAQGDSVLSTILTDSMTVYIKSAGGDTLSALHDIKPPVEIKRTFSDYLPYIVILAIIILAVLAFWLWNRFLKKSHLIETGVSIPQIDPYEYAMKRMVELKNKNLWNRGFVKDYYAELSEIVKEYIEHEFHSNSLEMTTEEFLDYNKEREIVNPDNVRKFLTEADLVKFAKYIPLPKECERAREQTYDLLKEAKTNSLKLKSVPENITDSLSYQKSEAAMEVAASA